MSRVAITDNTSTLDLVFESGVRKCIHKATCSIERVEDVLHVYDCGISPPKEYVIPYDEVTNYSFTDCIEFFNTIKLLLNSKYSVATVVAGVELNNHTTIKIADANPNRKGLVISNSSNHGFYVKFQAATVDNDLKGIFIPPTSNYELTSTFIYTGEISGISHESSPTAYVQEW